MALTIPYQPVPMFQHDPTMGATGLLLESSPSFPGRDSLHNFKDYVFRMF